MSTAIRIHYSIEWLEKFPGQEDWQAQAIAVHSSNVEHARIRAAEIHKGRSGWKYEIKDMCVLRIEEHVIVTITRSEVELPGQR